MNTMEIILTVVFAVIVVVIFWFWRRSRRSKWTVFDQWPSPTFISAGGQGAVMRVENDRNEVYALKISIRKLERNGLIYDWLRILAKKWKMEKWFKASTKTNKFKEGLILNYFKEKNPEHIVKCIDWGIEKMILSQVIDLFKNRWGKLENMGEPENVFRNAYNVDIFPSWDIYVHLEWQLMEICQMSLNKYIKDNPRIPLTEKLDILHQCARGLVFVHQKLCIHCDIKPDNILYNGTCWKICDFGLASKRPLHEKRPNEGTGIPLPTVLALPAVGTALFMAREIWKATARPNQPNPANSKVDVYSLGMTFIRMLCSSDDEFEMIAVSIRNGSYNLNKFIPKVIYRQPIIDVLTLMTHPIPDERLSSGEALAKIEALGSQEEPQGFIYCFGSNQAQFYDSQTGDWKPCSENWGQPFNSDPFSIFKTSQGKIFAINSNDVSQVSELVQIEHACCASPVKIWRPAGSPNSLDSPPMSLDASVFYDNFIYILCGNGSCFQRFHCLTKQWEILNFPLLPPWFQHPNIRPDIGGVWLFGASLVTFNGCIYANDNLGYFARYVIEENQWYTVLMEEMFKNKKFLGGVIKTSINDKSCNRRYSSPLYYLNIRVCRSWPGIVAYNDYIYIFGGKLDNKVYSSCKRYFVGDGTYETDEDWEILADMPHGRYKPSVVTFDEKFFIIGGLDSNDKLVKTIDIYDPVIKLWLTVDNTEIDWPACAIILE